MRRFVPQVRVEVGSLTVVFFDPFDAEPKRGVLGGWLCEWSTPAPRTWSPDLFRLLTGFVCYALFRPGERAFAWAHQDNRRTLRLAEALGFRKLANQVPNPELGFLWVLDPFTSGWRPPRASWSRSWYAAGPKVTASHPARYLAHLESPRVSLIPLRGSSEVAA